MFLTQASLATAPYKEYRTYLNENTFIFAWRIHPSLLVKGHREEGVGERGCRKIIMLFLDKLTQVSWVDYETRSGSLRPARRWAC